MRKGTITATVMAAALALAMSACNTVTMSGDVAEDGTRTYTLNGCKAEDMTAVNFTIEQGQSEFVVESDLSKGTAHVKLNQMADMDALLDSQDATESNADAITEGISSTATVLSYDATGTGSNSLPIEPGDYMLEVTGDDADPATGTLTISAR